MKTTDKTFKDENSELNIIGLPLNKYGYEDTNIKREIRLMAEKLESLGIAKVTVKLEGG